MICLRLAAACFLTNILCLSGSALANPALYTLADTGERTSDAQTVHIRGVSTGAFNPDHWTSGPPHLVADIRHPLLEPKPGNFRNIYAPSAVARPDGGWYIYYGGWDGLSEGRDAIYVTTTSDFLSFGDRHNVVSPGIFQHVCNVNGELDSSTSGVTLMCTAYPDANNRNKPVLFQFPQPIPPEPKVASLGDIIDVRGYSNYPNADINGMNVLLRDGDRSLLYFGDFQNFGSVHVAETDPGSSTTFNYKGVALAEPLAVNDVKRLRDPKGQTWYLMGLHMNRGALYYSLSQNPASFPPSNTLATSRDDADKHIVALGWVTNGTPARDATRVLGVLYGAGAVPTLDRNRIYARWFQKHLTFATPTNSPDQPEELGAFGPSTAVFKLPGTQWSGDITIADPLGQPGDKVSSVTLQAGHTYELRRMTSAAAAFKARRGQHKATAAHDPLNCDCLDVMPWERRGAKNPASSPAIAF